MSWIRDPAWTAGRVWVAKDGARTYYINRKIDGRSFNVSTRATQLRAAYEQLARFERDPSRYSPEGEGSRVVIFDEDLIEEYVQHGLDVKGNLKPWAQKNRKGLKWWMERLPEDLRRPTLRDFESALAGQANRIGRVKTIRAFYSWLVETERLRPDENQTARLKHPSPQPAQWRRKRSLDSGALSRIRDRLEEPFRSAFTLQMATGCHVSEVHRFSEGNGRIEDVDGKLIVLFGHHKRQDFLRVQVSKDGYSAALFLLEYADDWSIRSYYGAVHKACAEAGINRFSPGGLRHSFVEHALNSGADPAVLAQVLGHRSPATTRNFYATYAVPPKVPDLVPARQAEDEVA